MMLFSTQAGKGSLMSGLNVSTAADLYFIVKSMDVVLTLPADLFILFDLCFLLGFEADSGVRRLVWTIGI